MGQVSTLRQQALEEEEWRTSPAQGRLLTKRARGGGGGGRPTTAPQHHSTGRRHRKGPAPSCQFYQRPRAAVPAPRGSCNSQKQKPQRRNFPGGPGRLLGHHPFTGQPGPGQQPGATRHNGSQPCCHSGACWLPCPSGREAKPPGSQLGWGQADGLRVLLSPCPRPGQLDTWWRLAAPPLYSPSFWEKIFSKVTSPRSSRYFCMTLRMLKDRGATVTRTPSGLLSQNPEWGALTAGGCVSLLPTGRQTFP